MKNKNILEIICIHTEPTRLTKQSSGAQRAENRFLGRLPHQLLAPKNQGSLFAMLLSFGGVGGGR